MPAIDTQADKYDISLCIDNDEKFKEVIIEYSSLLLRVAYAYMRSRPDAEDVIQDTFFYLYKKKRHFDSKEHLRAWLLRVCLNYCKSKFRSAWFRRTSLMTEFFDLSVRDENPFEHEALLHAIQQLPEKYKSVILLFYYEGFTTAEIAAILCIKESTTRSLIHRARGILKGQLEGDIENG